jgi:integrase
MPTVDFPAQLERTMTNVQESESICASNKELIREYTQDRRLDGLKDATLLKNAGRMKIVAEHLESQRLDEMGKQDIKDLVVWLYEKYDKESTINTYKTVIRGFWKWLEPGENGDAPAKVAWIKQKGATGRGPLPKDLLKPEEVQRQIEAANNPRDKALISLLYETGARVGEVIDIKVGDIEDRKHGKKVNIDGKTGPRRVPLIECVPHLNRWLSDHPNPQKSAPLWCKIQQGNADEPLSYDYISYTILSGTMERAGIEKKSNPHIYRHSRASKLANDMTEAQMNEFFGWTQGSDVPARYVHLSGRDIDNAYDAMHGLYDPEEDGHEPQIRECGRCQELNEPEAAFCMRCGYALDGRSAADFESGIESDLREDYGDMDPEDVDTREKLEAMNELLSDPDIKTALLEHLAESD